MSQYGSRAINQPGNHRFKQAKIVTDEDLGICTLYMNPPFRPCYTPQLLDDINAWQAKIVKEVHTAVDEKLQAKIRYAVLASAVPKFFNVGGDLNLFVDCIRRQDKGGLLAYATACVDVAHRFSVSFDLPVTTVALVQGNALGGGFEAALAANVIIAERGTQMGFPEVLFNLFPGMGAYSFLSRRIAPAMAERLILSGDLYSAETLYEMGVVNVLADEGRGEEALRRFVRDADRRSHAQALIRATRAKFNRVPYEELLEITRLWVECALQLSDRELKTMERLVRAQNRTAVAQVEPIEGTVRLAAT